LTRINLLPPERVKERKGRVERNYLWLVIALPLIVLLLMALWWLSMGSQIKNKDKELAAANKELADVQAKNAALKQYQDRQTQINQIEQTVAKALSGRVYWARILNNIAITCPLNVWLRSLNGSASAGVGTVTFEGYATQCPNRLLGGFFPDTRDYHPDFRPVAGWLDRMSQIEQFQRVWLSSAEPTLIGAAPSGVDPGSFVTSTDANWVIRFSSTASLDLTKATLGSPVSKPGSSPAPAPSGGSSSGGEK
jgi:Tfp pilus assembly protein PilN